jgi:hypothetical protein
MVHNKSTSPFQNPRSGSLWTTHLILLVDFHQHFTYSRVKTMRRLHQRLQTKDMYGWHHFYSKSLWVFFQDVNFKWDFFIQPSYINSRWACITCYSRGISVGSLIWLQHGYFTSHISHVLQPLDVSCFKPFKIASKKRNMVPW